MFTSRTRARPSSNCCDVVLLYAYRDGHAMIRKRILLADDHTAMLEKVRALLDRDYDVVGAVQDGNALICAARELNPDVIITDITMPLMSGFAAMSQIRGLGVNSRLIFLTIHSEASYLKEAQRMRADGYVLKAYCYEQLPLAVSKVLIGETYVSPELLSTLFPSGG